MSQQSSQPIQQASGSTNATIQPYYVGGGPTAQQYGNQIAAENAKMQNFGASIAPSFQDMFNKYLDVSNQQAGIQASKIGETLGSRGALYSSANLQQQADLRQRQTQDIALQAANFQTNLENQRLQAEQVRQAGVGQVMTAQGQLAQGEWGSREAAMNRAYQDFLRQSDVPPFTATGIATGTSIGGPSYISR
jgi:predicted amidohydrolase YtcJ